jgi:uncharacterized integral membrane protein (TIGR00697 family)
MIYANWFDPRFIKIPYIGLETVAGNLIFPLTFLISNIITEVYGFKHARRAIWCGFGFNLLGIIIGQIVIRLPSPDFANNSSFDAIINKSSVIVIASAVSYVIAEPINSMIMSKMKIILRKFVALRFVLSTTLASFIDSVFFISIAFLNDLTLNQKINMILTMWGIKVFIEIFGTPFSVRLVKYLKNYERMDIYDRKTKYNLFSLDTTYATNENEFYKHHKVEKDQNLHTI